MHGWINYAGAAALIVLGVLLYTVDADFPTAGIPVLAVTPITAGLVWVGVALRRRPSPDQIPIKVS